MADLLRKVKSLYASTANTFSTGTSVTITPNSVTGLPTDTEITLTFDRVDSGGTATPTKMERIIGTISGGNFVVRTSPATGRGADGTSDQAHTSPVVEYIPNAKDTNDLIDAILVQHTQAGAHGAITATSVTTNTIAGSSQFPKVSGEYDNGNSGTSKAIDWSKGDRQKVTITGDACAFTFSNAAAGQTLTLRVVEDGSGHTAHTWPTLKWPYGSAGTPTITASAINLYIFYFDGTNYLAQLSPGFS